jgi:acetyl-CoA C-acetyltransferase
MAAKHSTDKSNKSQEIAITSQRPVVFAEPIRTAIGAFGGSLKDVPAPDLGAVAIGAAVAHAKLRPGEVETVVMGNVVQAGTKMNPARQAAVRAGPPVTTPALTVNRVCGSGAQAIVSAAQEIALGNIDVAVAGGMENMDQAPYLVARGRWGYRLGDGQLYDSVLRDGLNDAFSDAASGWHTEDLVEKFQVTREMQDRRALRSQQWFGSAQAAGHFKSQIVAVEVPGKKGPRQFDKDEHNRPDTTLETLERLKPVFRPNGTITAGNAPGWNDAASAMVLAHEAWAEKRGVSPMARLVSYGIAAVEPGMFGFVTGSCGNASLAARRLGHPLGRARRDQRSVRGHRHRGCPRARISRRHRQCRTRGRCPWPSDRRNRRGADHQTHPLDAPGPPHPRPCHALHRRGQGIALAIQVLH